MRILCRIPMMEATMLRPNKAIIEIVMTSSVAVLVVGFIIVNYYPIQDLVSIVFRSMKPFYIGFGIAYILNRPLTWSEKKIPIPRTLLILMAYIVLIAMSALSIYLLYPRMSEGLAALQNQILAALEAVGRYLRDQSAMGGATGAFFEQLNIVTSQWDVYMQGIAAELSQLIIGTTLTLLNIFFGIIISIYMLMDKYRILKFIKRLIYAFVEIGKAEKMISFLKEVNEIFSRFLSGLIVEALVVGILAYGLLLVMDVKYALVLALIIMCTNVVPYLGPFLGAIPAVISTLTYDPIKALWLTLAIVILQQMDGNYIGPKIMGSYIGMAPIWVILSITIGGGLWGIMGVILAIPTGAIIKIVFEQIIKKKEDEKQLRGMAD